VHVITAEEWPMSATKIDKRGLRQRLADISDPVLSSTFPSAVPSGA
jgi:hypothetical protein